MAVVVLVGMILMALFCTCLWGVCRQCCHEEKKLRYEREKKLAAAALSDIVQRHRLQTPHKHDKSPPIHRWGGATMPNPRQTCSVAIVATSSSSSSSASTSPCYLKTLGRGRFQQSQRTQAFNRNVGSGRGSIARLLQEHSSSKASSSSAPSSLASNSSSSSTSSTSIAKSN